MNPTIQNRELISDLLDGQLAGDDFAAALSLCATDETAVAGWHAYHLIGDVLRSPGLAPQASDEVFVQRLRSRLMQEPAMDGRVGPAVVGAGQSADHVPLDTMNREAANDGRFRWKLVAGLASLVAVVALGWNAGSGLLAPTDAPQLALSEAPQQVLVMSQQGPVVRDARLQELLAEHKQFGGTSALQMPSGFLRNATFEPAQRERR